MTSPIDDMDKTQLTEDLDVFEEFESADGVPQMEAHESVAPRHHEEEPAAQDDVGDLLEDAFEAPQSQQVRAQPEEPKQTVARGLADELMALTPDVPINLSAVVGRAQTTVGDLMNYRIGQVIDLGRTPGETVDITANGRLIARGELVEMDGKMAVRILKMVR